MDKVKEFKNIIKIIPTDELTTIKICDTVEKFMRENPVIFKKITKEEYDKIKFTPEQIEKIRRVMERIGGK
jgi:hypothetical protein